MVVVVGAIDSQQQQEKTAIATATSSKRMAMWFQDGDVVGDRTARSNKGLPPKGYCRFRLLCLEPLSNRQGICISRQGICIGGGEQNKPVGVEDRLGWNVWWWCGYDIKQAASKQIKRGPEQNNLIQKTVFKNG